MFVSKDTIFYLLWYNVIRWSSHIYEKSFLSFHSLLFLENNTWKLIEQNWYKVGHRWMGWKKAIMQVTCFLNSPMVNFLFYCHIILYWKKVTFYENFSQNTTIEVQIVWKISAFQRYWWKYQMLKNSWISKNFI